MEEIKTIAFNTCVSLIIGEIIYFITPKDKIIECVYSLMYTVIISFSIFAVLNLEYNDFIFEIDTKYQDEIDQSISEYYIVNTEIELKKMIIEALSVLNIEVSNIETQIEIDKDDIVIENILITLKYKNDIENSTKIIETIFGCEIPMEVVGEK